jgi:hypothetical protein
VYFGEITHSPSAGGLVFADPSIDEKLGSYWQLPAWYDDARPRRVRSSPVRSHAPVIEAGAPGHD